MLDGDLRLTVMLGAPSVVELVQAGLDSMA